MSNDSTRKAAALRKVAEALRAWGQFNGYDPLEASSPKAREAARTALDLATQHLRIIIDASNTYGYSGPTARVLPRLQEITGERERGYTDLGKHWGLWQDFTQSCVFGGSPVPVGFPDDLEHWADQLEKAGAVAADLESHQRQPGGGAAAPIDPNLGQSHGAAFPWGRASLAIAILIVLESFAVMGAWVWGDGLNLLQKIGNCWWLLAFVPTAAPFVFRLIVGREGWSQVKKKWHSWRGEA
jgi:hypothetical protein